MHSSAFLRKDLLKLTSLRNDSGGEMDIRHKIMLLGFH